MPTYKDYSLATPPLAMHAVVLLDGKLPTLAKKTVSKRNLNIYT